MKVLNIDKTPKAEGGFVWSVTLAKKDGTPSKVPLTESTQPTYKVGDEIYSSNLELIKPDEGDWYYKRKEGSTQVSRGRPEKSYKADPEKLDDIMIMSAWKIADEQIRHHIVPAGKVDTGLLGQIANEIFASMVMMRPKRKTND